MNRKQKEQLLTYLLSFASENKQQHFQRLLSERTRHITIVLEDIYQPQNASAVLRTADCFGIQDVHVIENTNEYEVNPRVVHGASKWLNLNKYNETHDNTTACIQKLKEKGYRIVATSPHAESVSLHDLAIEKPLALMFGTEKLGLSSTAMELADDHMFIPMHGFTESFNISVSAAICLHFLTQKIRESNVDWHLSDEEKFNLNLKWVKSALKDPEGLEKRFRDENNI